MAGYTSGGWRFVTPAEGMSVYVKADAQWANFRSGSWELGIVRGSSVIIGGQQIVGSRGAAIAAPASGATIDTEARAAINQILSAMRQHGLIAS